MSNAARRVRTPLQPTQVRWLGMLLLAAQVPQALYLPAWAAACGVALVLFRLAMEHAPPRGRAAILARLPSYVLGTCAVGAAIALYYSFGYFLGRDPCVAFLFILVGIKYLEARTTRDGTLLLCLASFLIVTPFFYGQSPLAAAATLPGLVLLAASLQMLAPPAGIDARPMRWREPLRRAVRLLLEGVPLAVLLFVLFPRLSAPLWGLPSDFTAKSGLSERMAPGTISELSLSDAVAFRVDFAGTPPPPRQRYWRGPVLSRFDGVEWSAAPTQPGGRFASPRGAPLIIYTVTLEPNYKTWLFALDLPAGAPEPADPLDTERAPVLATYTRDHQLLARLPVTQTLRYTQVSVVRDAYPEADESADGAIAANLALPAGSPKTRAFARDLRAAYIDDAALVAAVLAWFRAEPFVYTLNPPLLTHDPVDSFLFGTRRGFCEHYASAFVVLLRAAGIPARVVTGYQGGAINPNGGYLIVRQSDAHAWAEALIHGEWRRFDPTAAVAPSRIELGLGGALPAEDRVPYLARLDDGWFKGVELAWDAVNHGWRRNVVGFNFVQQQNLWHFWQFDRLAPWQMVLAGALMTAAWALGLLLWFALRHHQRGDRAVALWTGVGQRLARAGLPRAPHEGPLAYCARAAARWPGFAAAFTVIGDAYATLRYGPATSSPDGAAARRAIIARLAHAIAVLPAARALRRAERGDAKLRRVAKI